MAAAADQVLPPLRDDVRALLRHAGIAAVAGAATGLVVGGILGRIAMLVLRLTTGESAIGVTSDDGFEIGRFTLPGTLNLMFVYSLVGCALGLVYAVVRRFLPARARVAAWTAVCAAVGGGAFVHTDGVDYLLLDPLWLAVAFFVLLPGAAGLCMALAVERLETVTGNGRWQLPAAGIAAVATFAVPLAVGGALLALGRAPVLRRLADRPAIRGLALAIAVVVAVVAAVDLAQETRVILGR
jgi:hypothetical protein